MTPPGSPRPRPGRRPRPPLSLRRTLLSSILLGLLVVLTLSGLAVFAVARAGLRRQFDEALASRARAFAAMVAEEKPDPEDPGEEGGLKFEFEGPLDEATLGVLVRVTGDDGRLLAQSPGWPRPLPATIGPMLDGGAVALSDAPTEGRPARLASLAVRAKRDPEDWDGSEPSPRAAAVEVLARLDGVLRTEAAVASALGVGGLLAAAGACVAAWLGVRRGLSPVRGLCAELEGVDPAAPAPPSGQYPAELRPIVRALGAMLERVGAAMRRERRFTDAAAHELRTPIAELRTITDVAARWPEPPRLRAAVGEARAVADEMESLLQSLLAVARGGGAFESQPAEPVPLLPLARALLEARAVRLRARGVSCVAEGDEAARWTGPRGAVLAIVRNLIDNAAAYTPDGGSVRVAVRGENGRAALEVENAPVTLGPEQAGALFEPFWKADAARADRGRRGLGLAIVASMCDSLGLRRQATVEEGGRLRVRVEC